MALFFLIASAFLWLALILFGMSVWMSGFVCAALSLIYLTISQRDKLQQKPLVESKVILALSFWSCVALALDNYEKSFTCLNCIRSYLNTRLTPNFGTDFLSDAKIIWQNYPRFITIVLLLVFWSIIFGIRQYKKGIIK